MQVSTMSHAFKDLVKGFIDVGALQVRDLRFQTTPFVKR